MPTLETIAKWLKDSAGKIVVPKTLTSCVLDSNGKTVDERLEECENGNISIRYNSETDYVQLKIGGEWKDYIRAFALFKPLECKFIKINFTKLNSNSPNYVSLKEIRLKDSEGNYLDFSNLIAEATAYAQTTGTESAEKTIDGKLNTKWAAPWGGSADRFLQIYIPNDVIDLSVYNTLEFYVGDQSDRMPVSFTVSISTDGNKWKQIISESNITPLSTTDASMFYSKTISET